MSVHWTKEQNEKRSRTMKNLFSQRKINYHLYGRIPWSRGITKYESSILMKHAERMKGRTPWNKGKKGCQTSWRKGLTKKTDERIRKQVEAFVPWSKGLTKKNKRKS